MSESTEICINQEPTDHDLLQLGYITQVRVMERLGGCYGRSSSEGQSFNPHVSYVRNLCRELNDGRALISLNSMEVVVRNQHRSPWYPALKKLGFMHLTENGSVMLRPEVNEAYLLAAHLRKLVADPIVHDVLGELVNYYSDKILKTNESHACSPKPELNDEVTALADVGMQACYYAGVYIAADQSKAGKARLS